MLEFFAKLFDTSDFPARWKCVAWSEGHGWLHILSDLGVWSAYVTIPLVLGYFILRKKVLPFRGVLALFVAFILACGTTHLMEAIIFWWPAYRLAGLIKLLTAIVSWVTVVALVPIIPKLLSMRSPEEFEREIAERQHATLALQQSVARFALAQQAASIGAFEWDIGSNRVLWTPELEALYGLPPGGFGGRYENWVAALHPMDAAEAERQVRRAIEEHEDFNTEFRIGWPDGSEHWIEALARVQHNPDGSPSRMVGIHMDVSRRKQAEAELRKTTEELLHAQEASQQRATLLQAIFDSIGEGLVVADETGKFLQWNPAAQRILGLGGKDVPPERWTEEYGLFLPDQVTPCEPQELPLARAIRGEEVDDVELFVRHATLPDGAWINVTGRPLREVSGKLRGGVVIFRDVSEVKRGQETHARLASLVESSNDAIISKTLDSLITSWNAGAEKLFGYRADEVLGQSITLLIPPDHMDEEPAILDRIKKGASVEHYETIRRRKNGVLIDVSLTVSPIKDAGGRIVGASQIARDVTERKQAEVALRESEERFRLAVIDAPFPVLLHAEDGEILQISESWTEISGYASEELRTIADWTQRAYGERKELVKSDIDRLYGLEGRRHEGEYTITTRGGEQRTWDFSSAPLGALPDGRRLVISMAMDVTDRKGAEEQLRQLNAELEQRVQLRTAELEDSRNRLRTMFEEAPLGIAVIDSLTGQIYEVNPRFAAIAGRSREEMATIDWMTITHPDDVQEDLDGMAALNAGKNRGFSMQKRYRHPDGCYVWINMTITPLTVEDITRPRHLCMIEDIGARIRAETAIKERNAQLENANAQIQRNSALLAAIHEAQTQFITAEKITEAFADLLQNLLTLTGSEYGFVDEINYPPDGPPYLTALAITNIAWNEETRALYPKFLTGELRFTNLNSLFGTVMTTGAPVIANDAPRDARRGGVPPGHPALNAFLGLPLHSGTEFVGVLGLANAPGGYSEQTVQYLEPLVKACANIIQAWRNDQRRRQAEESLRLLNARLDQRGAELEAANKELEAFSYSVSHDLRAPLRAIDGFSKILLSEYSPILPEDAKTYLNDVRRNTQKMGRLIDDLLTFSRTGKQAINKQTIHTERLIRSCLEDLREEQKDRHIEIVIGDIPPCDADPALLKQVWINLLANALKYSRKRDPARIEIGCQTNNDGIGAPVFFIRDNGVGFDMQYAGRLFGVFQRLHRPADYEGTGVGLAIVQRIIQRHGGNIWAEAQLDQGATFSFTLEGESNHG